MFDVFYIGKKPGAVVHEQAVDTVEQAQQQSRTRYFWLINYLADYSTWDFLWEPVPWQAHQRHAWASQWQRDSGTYLIPKQGYTDTHYHSKQLVMQADPTLWENAGSVENFDFSWHPDYTDPVFNYEFGTQWQKTGGPRYPIKGASETKYVSQSGSTARAQASTVYVVDHMCGANAETVNTISTRATVRRIVRYFDNYLDTLTRIARNADNEHLEYIWICSSICDYATFDFTWHPEAWQNHMLHVFPSNSEKFGDTFFMHVPTFVAKIGEFELLEWYDLNFVATMPVPRRPMPVVKHAYDSQADAVRMLEFKGPLATFTTTDYVPGNMITVPLWREKTKTIVPLSSGAGSVVVPRTAVPYIKKQLYDYPHIDRTQRMLKDDPLDVVFISNGEAMAEDMYRHLVDSMHQQLVDTPNSNCSVNRIRRVENIKGRVAAYHAAAEASTTPWFFAVFAKLFVNEKFNWDWQPDRMQEPKHYIFHALNPVNGLEYGHQAMIAYNKQLVLANTGQGLDFTLDSAHEVVPILSGTAIYNISPWVAWRTAFREALKLRASLPDVENEYRLSQWLSTNPGSQEIPNEEWSRWGAEDAVEYYKETNGEFDALKKSYEWDWLASYAFMRRNLVPDH